MNAREKLLEQAEAYERTLARQAPVVVETPAEGQAADIKLLRERLT